MDDLNAFSDEVSADITSRGLDLLPALVSPGDGQATVLWSDPADWAGFIAAAQRLGARQIFLGRQFADNAAQRELAQVNLCWIHDATVYVLVRRAAWYADAETEPAASRAPGDLRERDEATLVGHMLTFVEGQAVDFDSLKMLKSAFWESRGVSSESADAETRQLMQRVGNSVDKSLFAEEELRLPELVAKCIAWARSQDFKRVNKTNVEGFLKDRDISLSRSGSDALYNETNLAMARYKN